VTKAPRFWVFVGSGGVGKTSLAAGFALARARSGHRTLVQTFDPSWRLKDALGLREAVETATVAGSDGRLMASLLDVRKTFDEVVARHAPDASARDRILEHRFYRQLAGELAGVLEYMAVERMYELSRADRADRVLDDVVLDTPPARQAFDLFEAPSRIVAFLDSGAARLGARPWFDARGRLSLPGPLALLRGRIETMLDETFGLAFLRELAEFFAAFTPLYDGFRERAMEVDRALRSPETRFVLVLSPSEERLAEASFFARRLEASGLRLAAAAINRLRPELPEPRRGAAEGWRVLHRLGADDARGAAAIERLLGSLPIVRIAESDPRSLDLTGLSAVGRRLDDVLSGS
jgi:anion-transporting  ArsA/GET3 family ATPase